MKVYESGQIGEVDRLEAIRLLEEHGFSPDDVYRLEVESDMMTIYRYVSPRQTTTDGQVAILEPIGVPL